jgi:hypothetical protein
VRVDDRVSREHDGEAGHAQIYQIARCFRFNLSASRLSRVPVGLSLELPVLLERLPARTVDL